MYKIDSIKYYKDIPTYIDQWSEFLCEIHINDFSKYKIVHICVIIKFES